MAISNHFIGNSHQRLRRLRQNGSVRNLVRETNLSRHDFIVPLFITEQGTSRTKIESLPGVDRIPLQELTAHCERILCLGFSAVMLFPVLTPDKKDLQGNESTNPQGLIQRAIQTVKKNCPTLTVFADVALDPFTTHGHDGIVNVDGDVENDLTVEQLCKMSVTLAQSGVDFVSPSDMMDGRIGAIRHRLDEHGFEKTGILAYSAKFASAFYGPFREAVSSGARGLDKRTYQLEPENGRQAVMELQLDDQEGADLLMVKPALPYLDIVAEARKTTQKPIVAYHVSGEYAMLKAAAEKGWLDEKKCVHECLTSIKRAGSDLIVSYYAVWAAENGII